MRNEIDVDEANGVESYLKHLGFETTLVRTGGGNYLIAVGAREIDIRAVGHLPGVIDVHRVSDTYKLVSRKWKVGHSEIKVADGISIGGSAFTIIAGPCAIESESQMDSILEHLASEGISLIRGGAFKPRTSPYSFQGLGLEGLQMLASLARKYQIKVVSEVISPSHVASLYDHIDVFQVGTRNMQNFQLLHELGKVDKPVLLKRGMSSTLEELLQSAEYIFSSGNERLILCERGIRTFERSYRNTLDLNAIPVLKDKSHLPVIVDPSHGIGIRRFVTPLALAAVMAGADGLLVEVHGAPELALSDGAQSLNFQESSALIRSVQQVHQLRLKLGKASVHDSTQETEASN